MSFVNDGYECYRRGDYNQALTNYLNALREEDNSFVKAEINYFIGMVYYKMNEFAKTREYCDVSLSNNNLTKTKLLKAKALNALKEYEEAIGILDELLLDESSNAIKIKCEVYSTKGWSLLGLKEYNSAKVMFEKFVEIKPNNYEGHYGKGIALMSEKKYDIAENSLQKASELNPQNQNLWYQLGKLYERMSKYELAVESYEEYQRLAGGEVSASFHYNFGNVLYRNEELLRAIEEFTKVEEIEPQNPKPSYKKALIYKDMRNTNEALDSINKALELELGNVLYLCTKSDIQDLLSSSGELPPREGLLTLANAYQIFQEDGSEEYTERDIASINEHFEGKEATLQIILHMNTSLQNYENDLRRDLVEDYNARLNEVNLQIENMRDHASELTEDQRRIIIEHTNEVITSSQMYESIQRKEERAAKIREIEEDIKLNEYYKYLKSTLNKAFVGALAIQSGFVETSDKENIFFKIGEKVPLVGKIFEFLNFSISTIREIREENRLTKFTELAVGIKEWEEITKRSAIAITLNTDKSQEIREAIDSRGKLKKFYDNCRDIIYENKCDTPAKMLALEDASKILQKGMLGQINLEEEIIPQFVNVAVRQELETYNNEHQENAGSSSGDKCSCTILPTLIEYDNPVLNEPELLAEAHERGGSKLVNVLIDTQDIKLAKAIIYYATEHPEIFQQNTTEVIGEKKSLPLARAEEVMSEEVFQDIVMLSGDEAQQQFELNC